MLSRILWALTAILAVIGGLGVVSLMHALERSKTEELRVVAGFDEVSSSLHEKIRELERLESSLHSSLRETRALRMESLDRLDDRMLLVSLDEQEFAQLAKQLDDDLVGGELSQDLLPAGMVWADGEWQLPNVYTGQLQPVNGYQLLQHWGAVHYGSVKSRSLWAVPVFIYWAYYEAEDGCAERVVSSDR